ncbi:MAG: protein kinase [Planctomycetes bacterium]|nr:protein kinase [Planctomycetota bacterium]
MSISGTIDELLIRWQDLRQRGLPASVRELCVDHPALTDELAARIKAFESMEALLGLGQYATLPGAGGGNPSVPRHLAEKLLPLGYELIDVIDQGGMGVIYKATQVKLRRIVALKMIAGFRVGPKQLARFRVEVEAVAQLQHPHIVQIYEVGEVDGHSYFSMEYLEGGTLSKCFSNGPLPPIAAAELLEVLARAIHHAHTRGIVHRDLKPGNILLAKPEIDPGKMNENAETVAFPLTPSASLAKVADFGLAKRLGADTDHTATGEVVGTPCYMAPEQAEGRSNTSGPACDQYALGAILYEALTGRPPFQAGTVLETLQMVSRNEPDAPRSIRPEIPRDLEAICLKCLEKKPSHRYPSAEALADDLRRFVGGLPVKARPLSRTVRTLRWCRRRPIRASGLVLLAVASVALIVWQSGYIERQQSRKKAVAVAPQAREILKRNCYECHGGSKSERGFLVLDRASLLDLSRKNVVPGHPDQSRLIQRIVDGTMPPKEDELYLPRVTPLELGILRDWIAGGAPEFPPEDPTSPTPPVVPRSELAAEVKAILVHHCYECHQLKDEKGGIRVMDHNLLIDTRAVVKPGSPDESELYKLLLLAEDAKGVMPPMNQPRMEPEEIDTIRRWIEAGAPPFPPSPKPPK